MHSLVRGVGGGGGEEIWILGPKFRPLKLCKLLGRRRGADCKNIENRTGCTPRKHAIFWLGEMCNLLKYKDEGRGHSSSSPPILRQPCWGERTTFHTPFQARVIKIPRFQNAPCTHLANGKPSFYQDQCCGSVLVWMWIRNLLLTSMRIQIRIQGAKPMRIHADPYTSQNFTPQKVDFLNEKYTLLYVGNES